MQVTRYDQAKPYDAPGHAGMTALRLQGHDASACRVFWVGLSHFLPAGGAQSSASNSEKVYVVLSGELTVVTDDGEITLKSLDSCYLAAGERREIVNRTNTPVAMLVVMSYQSSPAQGSPPTQGFPA
jgi:mannose-6-phosphate isomerase-like protein (cupin superfamily)